MVAVPAVVLLPLTVIELLLVSESSAPTFEFCKASADVLLRNALLCVLMRRRFALLIVIAAVPAAPMLPLPLVRLTLMADKVAIPVLLIVPVPSAEREILLFEPLPLSAEPRTIPALLPLVACKTT